MALQLLFDIGGCPATNVDVTQYLYAGEESASGVGGQYVNFSKSTNQRWTCTFTLIDNSGTGAHRPAFGQTFRLLEDSVLRFSGFIDDIDEGEFPNTGIVLYACSCSGWASLLDHRAVKKIYQTNETAALVVSDILANLGESITQLHVVLAGSLTAPVALQPVYASQAFDTIRDMCDAEWWIDESKDLHFIEVGNGPALGWSLTDSSRGEWLDGSFKIKRTGKDYRNVEYVVSDSLGQPPAKTTTSNPIPAQSHVYKLLTDYYDWVPDALNLTLSQPVQIDPANPSPPSVLEDGFLKNVYNLDTDPLGQIGYYYRVGSDKMTWGNPLSGQPGSGSQVAITYQAFAGGGGNTSPSDPTNPAQSNAPGVAAAVIPYVVQEDAAQIAARAAVEGASGRWEHITSLPGVNDPTTANALASGLLQRSAAIPDVITIQTWRSDYVIGGKLTVTRAIHGINGSYTVQQIQAQGIPAIKGAPVSAQTFLYTVTLSNEQNIGDYIKWFEGLVRSIGAGSTGGSGSVIPQGGNAQPQLQLIREVPSGVMNGSNVTFTLTYTPQPPWSLMLKMNGVLQHELGSGNDYSLSGKTITMSTAPRSDDRLEAHYFIMDAGVSPTVIQGSGYSTGAYMRGGDIDWHWTMYLPATPGGGTPATTSTPAYCIDTPYPPTWNVVDSTIPAAQWIGPAADGSGPWSGMYRYETTFQLRSTTGSIVLNVAGNGNKTPVGGFANLKLYLNGVLKLTVTPPTNDALHSVTITSDLVAGKNTIRVDTYSDDASPKGGLLVQVVSLP